MGSALVQGMVARGVVKAPDLRLSDAFPVAAQALATQLPGAVACGGNVEALAEADALLVCVKPGDVAKVLQDVAALPPERSMLVISIAAGVKIAAMEAVTGPQHRVVRVMPNTPALVGRGAAGYCLGSHATPADGALVDALLSATGEAIKVTEPLLDAVTGLSGSGPAYVYTIIEALADGGLLMGLSKEQSLKLAAHTVAGAAEMVIQTGLHPAVLRDQVTSPGGTTIAGLATLEDRGVRAALMQAVKAATLRSKELGA